MDIMEVIKERHSVRSYNEKAIDGDIKEKLASCIEECNKESGLHMQLILNEPQAFGSFRAHYGNFSGVRNYIAMIGKKGKNLDEKCGYYGEKVVLKAQELGLNTCWVAATYNKIKTAFQVGKGEKLRLVIAVGFSEINGTARKSKTAKAVTKAENPTPEWFQKGIEAALLAPTALNQQKFLFTLNGNVVTAKANMGFCAKIDLGIAKCHFELGAGKENFNWG